MFSRVIIVLALAVTVVMAHPSYRQGPVDTCNKGDLQCCNQVQTAKTVDFSKLYEGDVYSVLPDALRGSNIPVGLTCSPLVDALSAKSCNQQTVCCDGGHFSGLISLNCNAYNGGAQGALGLL